MYQHGFDGAGSYVNPQQILNSCGRHTCMYVRGRPQPKGWGHSDCGRGSLQDGAANYILAQYDDDSVVVYQAYCPKIAEYAVKHQK